MDNVIRRLVPIGLVLAIVLAVVIIVVVTSPRPAAWYSDDPDTYNQVPLIGLPKDICVIDGNPVQPELTYVGYGAKNGAALSYVTSNGNIALLVKGELIAVVDGDFCRAEED